MITTKRDENLRWRHKNLIRICIRENIWKKKFLYCVGLGCAWWWFGYEGPLNGFLNSVRWWNAIAVEFMESCKMTFEILMLWIGEFQMCRWAFGFLFSLFVSKGIEEKETYILVQAFFFMEYTFFCYLHREHIFRWWSEWRWKIYNTFSHRAFDRFRTNLDLNLRKHLLKRNIPKNFIYIFIIRNNGRTIVDWFLKKVKLDS